MTGAEIVFEALEDQGVKHIFGYPGGAVLPIYDELKNHKKIKHILVLRPGSNLNGEYFMVMPGILGTKSL